MMLEPELVTIWRQYPEWEIEQRAPAVWTAYRRQGSETHVILARRGLGELADKLGAEDLRFLPLLTGSEMPRRLHGKRPQ